MRHAFEHLHRRHATHIPYQRQRQSFDIRPTKNSPPIQMAATRERTGGIGGSFVQDQTYSLRRSQTSSARTEKAYFTTTSRSEILFGRTKHQRLNKSKNALIISTWSIFQQIHKNKQKIIQCHKLAKRSNKVSIFEESVFFSPLNPLQVLLKRPKIVWSLFWYFDVHPESCGSQKQSITSFNSPSTVWRKMCGKYRLIDDWTSDFFSKSRETRLNARTPEK